MNRPRIAPEFDCDGSLRDIYIHNCSMDDWGNVWGFLLLEPNSLSFTVDGQSRTPPADVAEAFALRSSHSVYASYTFGRLRLNYHFFNDEEIEFDLDPRDINDPAGVDQLAQFLTILGRSTSREVRLTHENNPNAIIACYMPNTGQIIWMPVAA